MVDGERAGDKQARIGVLLVNLGSPEATNYRFMRRYLKQFLSDRRVIETSRLVWYPLLYTLILSKRPQKSGGKYQRIWNYVANEPPLVSFTRSQAQKLQLRLERWGKYSRATKTVLSGKHNHDEANLEVGWAMRYGRPSIEEVTQAMVERGCKKMLLFALYPQYSAATTASTHDCFFAALKQHRFQPTVRTVPSYPDDPAYIHAVSASILRELARLSFVPEVILASYHGLPLSYVQRGDPYAQECQLTTKALKQALGAVGDKLQMSFQSRFGQAEWLQPYTDATVVKLACEGVKSIAIVNPGFASDCLETLDEMGHEVARLFRQYGGENFAHLPCLNDSDEGVDVLEKIVRRELAGWI